VHRRPYGPHRMGAVSLCAVLFCTRGVKVGDAELRLVVAMSALPPKADVASFACVRSRCCGVIDSSRQFFEDRLAGKAPPPWWQYGLKGLSFLALASNGLPRWRAIDGRRDQDPPRRSPDPRATSQCFCPRDPRRRYSALPQVAMLDTHNDSIRNSPSVTASLKKTSHMSRLDSQI
jgi:hypothetical protein